ncbi:hypothetical protein AX17_002820 [Amanita inopinata Kibby_2008]|nr:hypothetical protein AX17_002820 [Amanita inopinata Kibby_2008]
MAKGSSSTSSDPFTMDQGRKGRSDVLSESSSGQSRLSVLQSVKLPSLRCLDSSEVSQSPGKTPLLILKLSTPSFLNCVVHDETRNALYTIRTLSNTTSVMRSDPWEGMTKTADIKWPEEVPLSKGKAKTVDGIQIQMRGTRWKGVETLLKAGSGSSSPRKFAIPNYSQNLKWRRVGSAYWCTTTSVKGPVAILDPAIASIPAQLLIFETLHDRYDARPMLDHQGVSILLLDYLLVTSLFLVTDIQDWLSIKKENDRVLSISPEGTVVNGTPVRGITTTSESQWRKIMYGEPMYPKRQPQPTTVRPMSASKDSEAVPHTPTSPEKLAKIMHGIPIYPTLAATLPSLESSAESDQDEEEEEYISSSEQSRSPSPAAESVLYPLANTAAPSHTYLDPSFYNDDLIPPLTTHRIASDSGRGNSPSPSSPSSIPQQDNFQSSSILPLSPRPRSTPPQAVAANVDPLSPPQQSWSGPSTVRMGARKASMPNGTVPVQPPARRSSSTTRPLPRPPDGGGVVTARGIRHVQSHQRLGHIRSAEKRGSYSQRALPSPPLPPPPLNPTTPHRRMEDAGPVVNLHPRSYASHAYYQPGSPHPDQMLIRHSHPMVQHHQQKTPDEDELARWMGSLRTGGRMTVDDAMSSVPYDVPPPAYSSINFGG